MNLMTWLTGKTLAELVKKGQLIPPEIKLPVYPASHYKKKTGMNKVFLTEALLGLRRS
ncbi:hypothetical protein HHZ84_003689 [Salmonella enterica subsp. enterica serovar 4,[5],12:i:-]|nr:hypothetical protein [Salmonella enterica]EEG8314093.1 hypothetical protein [Salmonella enterica subsp. enterica]EGJ0259756.1 hypothetical protein [Salmonella enterica subsp. enterica serovar 4,[5],12:i:-]EEL1908607.1 hypothetical protein [Salmonella enterica]EEQ0347142.1 hypothetical protein [Salmonella enterica subsp. enterica]